MDGKRKQSNRSKRRDGFRRNLSAAGSPRLRNQTRCNHPFYRPAEIRMCPDRAGAAPRGTIFVKDDRDRSDGRRAPVDLRPASVESGRVHHVRTSRDPPSRGRTDWTQLVLDARMRPLAGMTAHESASLAREAARPRPLGGPLRPSCAALFSPISTKSGSLRALSWILGSRDRRTSRASVPAGEV